MCGLASKLDPVAMSRNPLRLLRNLAALTGSCSMQFGTHFLGIATVRLKIGLGSCLDDVAATGEPIGHGHGDLGVTGHLS